MAHFSVRAENKMPEGRGSSTSSRGAGLAGSEDIMDLLPLQLVRSQVIPPAPNRRESSIDWLPEFGGASWIAYGASSLLVISHFPSPFSGNEPQLGPFFRQVIEPPTGNKPAELTTVSWCPVQPSEGEIAVALGNNIFMYSPVTSSAPGSFSWRQTVVIVETFPIEIIGWTGSGDGLVAAGTEVVLWIRKSNLWEMTWKVRTAVPQTHVSASWFSDGLVATAAQALVHPDEVSAKESNYTLPESTKHVTVYFRDGKSGTTTVQLYHPQPIVMIQWRPHIGVQSQADASSAYNILLTCCLDGTVRLWSEIDNGRLRKFNKEIHDQKSMKRLFHVVAVIEMNQSLKGTLGTNIFVKWALDSSCAVFKGESGGYSLLPIYTEHQQISKCDWLIGIGPDFSVTFWAIHCLDDVSPPRFPRVTMWKKGHLMDFKDSKYPYFGSPNTKNQAILVKVVASRSWLCGPPIACSLLQLLPGNSFSWSELYNPSEKMEDTSLRQINKERSLSCIAHTALSELGHTGCIIQVAVHPCSFDISLAVSLDSNGLLLFWSLSTLSESILPFHTHIHPMWKLLDHISLKVLSSDHEYSCLVWGPAVLNENRFLLVGHEDGIDCFMIEVSCKEESISAHKVLTIPFNGYNDRGNPPDQIFAIPLIPNSRHSSNSSSFLLVCVWRENYKPLSWTIDLDMSINDGVSSNDNGLAISKGQCTSSSGKFCYASFYKHSFELPSPHCWDGVTTVTVASPTSCPLPIEQVYSNDSPSSYCGYHMATGYSGGTVKLWRICHMQQDHSDSENVPWELAGTFTAHEGPVNFLSLSSCSSKVATASIDGRNSTTSLHIWEFVKLTCGGSFVLEDAIDLNGILIAVRWLALGNGQMLLGICLPNEFRVYSQRRLSTHSFANSDTSKEMHAWYCIAVSGSSTIVRDFLWGPKLTAVIVHEKHFSVCSQWLLGTNSTYNVEDSVAYVGRIEESLLCATNTGKNMLDIDEQLEYGYSKKISQQDYVPNTENKLFYILDVSRKLGGALALYDPEALIQYIYSGNWKYAVVILKNFVECICSYKTSTTIPESDKQSLLSCKKLEVHLARYIEDNNSENSSSEKLFWGQNITTSGPNFHLGGNELQFLNTHLETNTYERIPDNSNKSEIMELIDTLEKSNQVSSLTNLMKTQILVILELLNEINNTKATAAYGSLDEAGRRFWVAVRFQYLYSMRRSGGVVTEDLPVNSRLAAWAFQSDCQDDLLNSVLSSDPSWVDMRNLGVGLWYTNASQLRTRMEKLARSEYLRNKNPKDCALLYLALNRLQVLISLFKISKDEKDKVLFGFLSRNFQDERNKAAALKNAYVLMGKHELKLAIAFFLLGGDSSSAVTVCAKNLGDDQLALVICRLLEGYGGSLEKQLISNILLPKALEKGDYWLSSLLEWTLGNYSQSVKTLVNGQTKQVNRNSAALCNYGALSDPDIGHYCVILASRNSFRCSVGENVAADLSKFASFLAASALNRCGVPLEALACLSYSLSSDGKDRKNVSTAGPHDIFHQILSPFTGDACNWVLDNVSHQLEVNTKTNIALYYIDSFLRNHPVWSSHSLSKSREVIGCHYVYLQEEDLSQMKQDLQMILSMFERKFLLKSVDIFNLVLLSAHNYGSLFLGYLMLHVEEFTRNEYKNWIADLIFVPAFVRLLVKSTVEILCFLARFVVSFNFTESMLKPLHDNHYQIHTILFCLKNMLCFIRTFGSSSNYYQGEKASEDFSTFFPFSLDLLEFYVDFAFACIEGNFKGLFMMINHILIALANDESSIEVLSDELRKFLCQNSQLVIHCASAVEVESISNSNFKQKHLETGDLPIADDEKWKLLWISLWLHMLNFAKHGLGKISIKEGSHNSSINNIITVFISAITKSLVSTIAYVSSSLVKLVASFLRQKALKGLPIPSILWLDEIARSHPTSLHYCLNERLDSLQLSDNKTQVSLKMLWDISICPVDICEHFAKEKVSCFPYYHGNQFDTWKDVQRNIFSENENDHINDKQEKLDSGSSYKETISGHGGSTMDNNGFVETGRKHSGPRTDISYFHNPREVTRRSGELFEAICFNSINEHEIAITSNKKGLIFFNLKYEEYSRKQADYIWSDCDWPKDGWAGSESTPVPTYISQGIGLGSKRGVHLGLGGATIGIGSLARPRRDLTGGGAFGIPGYAGIGAAGLGWGEEEFEEFRDPPATVENIHSRALARHPLLPFLLVGSSNTHVYLWEFGKQSAVATYGVLPAANVPPPYALASISALQFDHYGHRFATAALDGTICTWQLEVGGRSNVHPTDSSLCFDNHASDVAYVATSGSILAVAGSSTNGINVVLWDTLAPPATSQASLFCHEGGARSISVFDHVIGTGSISPIIVTGGRSGDVGLHDLRYIATGKTRRNRHASEQDLKTMHTTNSGISKHAENSNGMMWYIPKAHLGSVTRIATIPNTSLFLTGSKDGDVKLWDAKRSQLVFQWQKLHERHTFLQPNSRGFGGVVRAAVTDIQVLSRGFLTCGGDGSTKLIQLK